MLRCVPHVRGQERRKHRWRRFVALASAHQAIADNCANAACQSALRRARNTSMHQLAATPLKLARPRNASQHIAGPRPAAGLPSHDRRLCAGSRLSSWKLMGGRGVAGFLPRPRMPPGHGREGGIRHLPLSPSPDVAAQCEGCIATWLGDTGADKATPPALSTPLRPTMPAADCEGCQGPSVLSRHRELALEALRPRAEGPPLPSRPPPIPRPREQRRSRCRAPASARPWRRVACSRSPAICHCAAAAHWAASACAWGADR